MAFFRSLFTGGDKSYYEPSPRCWHHAAPVGEKLFMWGGRIQDWSSEGRSRLASVVETYGPYLELWEQHPTSGDPPAGLCNGACASLLDSLYSYGGNDSSASFSQHSILHCFDTTSMSWSEVEVRNAAEGPMKKSGCRMVAYQGDKLLLIGGYGIPTAALQPGGTFIKDIRYTDGRGWTNEVHFFHLQEGVWTSLATNGTRPPPCTALSLTNIDSKRVVFFGGRQAHGRVNDLYILDLEAMHWTKVDKSGGNPWPVGRSDHAACCINYGQEHPQLLVTGGLDNDGKELGDAWLLDVDSATWKELALPADLPPHAGHTTIAFSLVPGLTEVVMFGGYNNWLGVAGDWLGVARDGGLPKIAETTLLRLESTEIPPSGGRPSTQEWDLVGVARRGQLGSVERVREKMVKMHQRATMAIAIQIQVQELKQQVSNANTKAQVAEKGRVEAEKRAHEVETRAEQRAAMATQENTEQEQPFWVVERDEIQLTRETLGKGAWAEVKVANFRGIRVAAKCLHGLIASNYNQTLFTREMNVAAQLRHPNLLQFIGATLEGELIILTELMPTSLRTELERGALPHHQIISISLDVAQALNYLHLMRPSSIIHRDLSSANVLLEPKSENTWKAKVSDYGTVNLLQKVRTVMPGNPVYAAPESNDPLQQSPKMDIFSFGILLVEICTATFPDTADRERLIQSIADHRMVGLIRECTTEDRNERPSAAEIIARLNEM